MLDVDSTLRLIAQWKFIIAMDLTKAFYQIPLSRESWKYCGVRVSGWDARPPAAEDKTI